MIRFTLTLLLAAMSFGCATTSSTSYSIAEGDSFELRTRRSADPVEPAFSAVTAEPVAVAAADPSPMFVNPVTEFALEPAPRALTVADDDSNSYTVFKVGYYGADDDSLDDGLIINVAFGRKFGRLLALELEVGYLDSDGTDSAGFNGDLWAIPIMINGRVDIQVLVVSLYGGVGIGGIYFDAEKTDGILTVKDDGFVFGGNAFIGASFVLGGLSAGLEAKYYVTEDIDGFDNGLDALAVMLTLGFGV